MGDGTATRHFLNAVAHWVGVGLLANEAQQLAGWTPDRTVRALSGASPASRAPLAAAQRVASAIRAEPPAQAILARDDDPAETLEALRACSPRVRQALDAYLDEHGWQVFTGFDFTHQAIAELPGVLLATIRAVPPHDEPRANPMAELLEHVPAGDKERVAALIDDAVLAYGLRDDDSGLTIQQPLGLVRRALLEAGRRLEARGVLDRADDIFDATAAEVRVLLTRQDSGLRTELAGRAARRRAHGDVPPRRLGSDGPPPDEPLPPAMATVMAALFTAMQLEDTADDEAAPGMELRGSAASDGVYEGRARLVLGEGDFERLERGDVLVAPMTTPAYNVVLPLLGAVVTDRGGVLSHPAIVAREYGIPAVVGTGDATTRIADGARIRVDGRAGTVTILAQ